MKTQYFRKLFGLIVFLIVTVSINYSFSATHVWLVVGQPTPKPELGNVFTTYIGMASWNGVPGAVDFVISHDPSALIILNITLNENSPFFPNGYVDSTSSFFGQTHFVGFQSEVLQHRDTLFILGEITWQVVSIPADSITNVDIEVNDVVEVSRAPVEVFAFGQHIEFFTDIPELPISYKLDYNYPNPFNSSTIVRYHLIEQIHVIIKIYDILGQLVYTLVDEIKPQGSYEIKWNGNNDFGNHVATGVYLYHMEAGSFIDTKKMLLLR